MPKGYEKTALLSLGGLLNALLNTPSYCMKDNIRFETRDKHLQINYNFYCWAVKISFMECQIQILEINTLILFIEL